MLVDLLFIFFNCKVTNLLSPEAAEKVCHNINRYDYVLAKEIVLHQEFNRRKQMWRTA